MADGFSDVRASRVSTRDEDGSNTEYEGLAVLIEDLDSSTLQLSIDLLRAQRFLAIGIVAMVTLSTIGQFVRYGLGHGSAFGMIGKFWLDDEGNFPTLFSGVLLTLVGLLALTIAVTERRRSGRWWKHWLCVAVLFGLLVLDEMTGLHDQLAKESNRIARLPGFFRFQWVVVGIPIVGVLAVTFAKFVFALPHVTRRRVIAAACVYVSGAVGMELIGGKVFEMYGENWEAIPYVISATIEETLEMTGALICFGAFAHYLTSVAGIHRLRLSIAQRS